MNIGVVGSEEAKFTPLTRQTARLYITDLLLSYKDIVLVSGRCPLGGIDIWAEEIAEELGVERKIFPPKEYNWAKGYKPRNLKIARVSDVVYCLTVRELPPNYDGMRFESCYHCGTRDHVKSGGCWTAKQAKYLGKDAHIVVIEGGSYEYRRM